MTARPVALPRARRRPRSLLAAALALASAVALGLAPAALAQVSFSAPARFAVGMVPLSVEVGDLDGDANADLVVANDFSDDVSGAFAAALQ